FDDKSQVPISHEVAFEMPTDRISADDQDVPAIQPVDHPRTQQKSPADHRQRAQDYSFTYHQAGDGLGAGKIDASHHQHSGHRHGLQYRQLLVSAGTNLPASINFVHVAAQNQQTEIESEETKMFDDSNLTQQPLAGMRH